MPNFKLQLNRKMLRAVRNGSRISGVEIEITPSSRQIINVNPGGAVILAAGALSTPRILFNSGIGPQSQIQTVANGTTTMTLPPQSQWLTLPVGENLMDHPIFTVNLATKDRLSTLPSAAFTSPSPADVDLFAQGSGLLAQSGQRLNFWTSVNASDGIQRFVQGTCNSPSNNTIRMKVYLTHGLTSVGALGISADGSTKLTTQPYLNTDGDREAITTFMNQIISFASKSNSTLTISGNATAESLIRDYTTGSHFVGTAKMGTTNDGTSVVDTRTKVWGTDNLYVVDASMHPDLPTGNTQAMVMVAAEHAVQMILQGGNEVPAP
jgi:cellobiose dehydrogenase (acceptor)